jgi:competence ComEA-like helix-hairpin-helix protein
MIRNNFYRLLGVFGLGLMLWGSPVLKAQEKIDLNRASSAQLEKLPGIGKVLAAEIIADRNTNGAFQSVEDLSRINGISSRLIANIYDLVYIPQPGKKKNKEAAGLKKLKERFASEPSISDVQGVAVRYARANPDVIDSWRARARSSALLPEVRARVDNDTDDGTTTRSQTGEADVITQSEGDDVGVELRATWDLNYLVFHPQEMAVAREAVRLTNLRDRVVDEVTRRYYERRRLMVENALAPVYDDMERMRRDLRQQELTADLDALTGGWFSIELKKRGMTH